jgi:hypothetical protein
MPSTTKPAAHRTRTTKLRSAAAEQLEPGDIIQGTFWTSMPTETIFNYRDEDLYTLVIPTTQTIVLTLRSEMPAGRRPPVELRRNLEDHGGDGSLRDLRWQTGHHARCRRVLPVRLPVDHRGWIRVWRTPVQPLHVSISGESGQGCPADLDGNGEVGATDLATLLNGWGGAGSGDLNGNGVVDAQDLAVVLTEWGPCLP